MSAGGVSKQLSGQLSQRSLRELACRRPHTHTHRYDLYNGCTTCFHIFGQSARRLLRRSRQNMLHLRQARAHIPLRRLRCWSIKDIGGMGPKSERVSGIGSHELRLGRTSVLRAPFSQLAPPHQMAPVAPAFVQIRALGDPVRPRSPIWSNLTGFGRKLADIGDIRSKPTNIWSKPSRTWPRTVEIVAEIGTEFGRTQLELGRNRPESGRDRRDLLVESFGRNSGPARSTAQGGICDDASGPARPIACKPRRRLHPQPPLGVRLAGMHGQIGGPWQSTKTAEPFARQTHRLEDQ